MPAFKNLKIVCENSSFWHVLEKSKCCSIITGKECGVGLLLIDEAVPSAWFLDTGQSPQSRTECDHSRSLIHAVVFLTPDCGVVPYVSPRLFANCGWPSAGLPRRVQLEKGRACHLFSSLPSNSMNALSFGDEQITGQKIACCSLAASRERSRALWP